MASMQLKCNLTKCRDMDVYLDDSDIESHISAKHLSYLPLKCTWCEEENQDHFCATREDIKKHTSINHNGKNARYSVFEDDAKEDELKKLAKECRCSAIPQIISNDSRIALRRVLNVLDGVTSIANIAENGLQVKQENQDDLIVTVDDNDSAAVPNNYSEGNVLDQLPEHDAIEPTIQTRLRCSSNKSAANPIQRKRPLPMNDRHSRTNLPAKRPNSYASAMKSQVVRHMRTLTGEKPFKCSHCSFACAYKSSLNTHVRTHTGEKPYKCDRCSFACKQKSTLNVHMRTHTGEKPYKCYECQFAFADSSTLKKHMRTHTGEKPYKCDRCSFACAQKGQFNIHVRTHTGEKPYKCSECTFAGSSSSHLCHHVRRHHSKETE